MPEYYRHPDGSWIKIEEDNGIYYARESIYHFGYKWSCAGVCCKEYRDELTEIKPEDLPAALLRAEIFK